MFLNNFFTKKIKLTEAVAVSIEDETLTKILKLIAGLESRGKNIGNQTGSQAHGIYQFMPATFDLVKQGLDDDHQFKNSSWDEFKNNTDIQDSYAREGVMANVDYLNNKKIPINVETIYNAHHFGPFVASLMHKDPDRSLKDIYDQNQNINGMLSWETIKAQNPKLDDDSTGKSTTAFHMERAETPEMKAYLAAQDVNVDNLRKQAFFTPSAKEKADARAKEVGKIPYEPFPSTSAGAAQSTARQARRNDAINAELGGADSAGSTYSIKPGDTLSKIAKDNGTTVDALLKANPQIKDANSINAGAKLNLATPAGNAEEKSYADMGKTALPTSLSVTQRELKDAQAGLEALTLNGTQEEVAKAQADVDRLEGAVESNKDMQAGGLEGPASLTSDQADYAKAKEGALLQGKDDVTSIADDDLKRRRAEAYANQQEKNGNTEVADAARAEAKRHEALRMEKLTKGITFGQGSLEQQEQQMKQWDKTKAEGGDPTQSWKGGVITDPKELADWQTRNQEADRKQKEQGTYTIDKTIDDYKDEVDPDASAPQAQSYSAPVKSAGGDVKQGSGYSQGGVQKPATATAPQAQSYSAPVKSAGGDVKQGSGYSQGGVQKPATPKVDPYPNPGYTGEELRIYNQLSDGQKAKITTDFEKSKKYTAQQRKNITPRTGPTSIPDAKPRSLLDIKHQQTLSDIEGGKVLVDPAQARDVSKALGMRNLNSTEQKARDAAIAGLRFTAPSLQDIQKGMTPIVDKSTQYQSDRNANPATGEIGDAYGALSEPKVEPVKPVTTGSKQTVGSTQTVKPVKFSPSGAPIKETRDFENWVNSVGKV